MTLAALLLLAFSGFPPHATLKRSEPAKDAQLTAPPTRIALWFTERPELAFTRIQVTGPNAVVALGTILADTGDAVHADITGAMANGVYRVEWQAAGKDGHVNKGEFAFSIGAGAQVVGSDAPAAAESSSLARDRVMRLWEFAALLLVLGVLVFVQGVLPPLALRGVHTADAAQRARGLGSYAAFIYVVAAAYRLVRQAESVGANEAMPLISQSAWGKGWLVGATGAVLVLLGLWLARRRIAAGTPTALTGAFAMMISPALTGHAVASARFVPAVTLDAIHVAALGAWIGGLAVVVLVGVPAMLRLVDGNADAAVSALVNSFHPIALMSAPCAVLAGVGSAALRLGSVSALTSSRYGAVLITKVIGVLLVAGMGAWNSMRARKRLGTPQATQSLRKTAAVELVLALLVVWATTDLVATPVPPPMTP